MICGGCGYIVPENDPRPFRCPNAGRDDVDHVLATHVDLTGAGGAFFDLETNPFVRFRRLMQCHQTAIALGMNDAEYVALVRALTDRVAEVGGQRFEMTPLRFDAPLDVWIKDETSNVAGSHKGRHLMGLMIWLEVMTRFRRERPDIRLAIASCGNAALAAATIARAAVRPLEVYVPMEASEAIVERIESLGAFVTRCAREDGVSGDPSYRRFREAVAAGALPFTCQGNENGLVIEGGKTLGWEMVSQLAAQEVSLDRLLIQVGGGALASACIAAFEDALTAGVISRLPRIHAVQTAAVSPLARAWERITDLDYAIHHRSEFMWPWEAAPVSVAGGILDDETYDWAAVTRGMKESDGSPVVVSEERLIEAKGLAGAGVSATGAAGLAGLLELRSRGVIGDAETVAVLFTGAEIHES